MSGVDDEELPNIRHTCADCGQLSPPTTTSFTLISARHGWRLTLTTDSEGRQQPEWRCPACWQKFRHPSSSP